MECPTETEQIKYHRYNAEWHGIELDIRHCPCWLSSPGDEFVTQHIEIRCGEKSSLPITDTGYRSHFLYGEEALIEFDNDPVAFVLWWLDETAQSRAWQNQVKAGRQLDLF